MSRLHKEDRESIKAQISSHEAKSNSPAKKRSKKPFIITLIALGLVLLIAAAGLLFYLSKLNKIDFVSAVQTPQIDTSLVLEDETDDLGDLGELTPEDLQQAEALAFLEGDLFKDKDFLNVLLLGTDERTDEFNENARADSIMLVSLNRVSGNIKLVSIQRGMGVPIPGRPDDWITHTFRYGGAALTVQCVEKAFLIDIDGYVRVNFKTFAEIVDVVGGVDIELTELEAAALNDEVYTNAVAHTRVQPGSNHLDGYDALQYARLRFIDDDWHRIVRQRTVMKKMFEGVKEMGISEALDFADRVLPLVQTDFSRMEITSLLFLVPTFAGGSIDDISLPAEGTYYSALSEEGRVLNVADFAENSRILLEFIQS